MRLDGKTVMVSGAAHGIGRAYSEKLASEGASVAHVASKGALIGFSRTLAKELGKFWIRVNVVCPGSTLSEEEPDEAAIAMRTEPVKIRALQRVERPADLVGAIAFLQSDDSAFITGQTLLVDGGSAFH